MGGGGGGGLSAPFTAGHHLLCALLFVCWLLNVLSTGKVDLKDGST